MSEPELSVGATRTLYLPRARTVRFLIISAVFVAAGIFLLSRSAPAGWAATIFFGLSLIVFAVQLFNPSRLTLDADGFETRVLFRRLTRSWTECSAFSATGQGARGLVVYSTARTKNAALRAVNTALAGGDESIQAGFGGLGSHRQAELMNQYRDAKLRSQSASDL